MAKIVIALGGNALGKNPTEQQDMIEKGVPSIVSLIKQGHEVVISHGNGPQVGMIKLAFDTANEINKKVAKFELQECTAMSQGYIGYHLQKGLKKELTKQGLNLNVTGIITQIEVDKNDDAFKNPTKPIGSFYSKEDADKLAKENPTLIFKEDSGRGYRQMVASPKPINIVEKEAIVELVKNKFVVVACGGGGIPVVKNQQGDYEGIPAVIDKDFASAKLAELIDADYLFILTAVDRVAINFGKENQELLKNITVDEANKYAAEGHFAPGSMLPKVQAAIQFVQSKPERRAVIASLEKAPLAMEGKSGTTIQ
ncbi:carbamate kinase [Candidatus Epulonipiscium fishelsonii]|uniref:Carbamate kinase n=1 Tax=Candidatus Epulonipiscium fishelsonii TaxID=77094 RepID=A0ACC8XHL4_9FIRM|nr:carbamate kinase [Epulopiscium sp. SCG-D08WGA-EpuloA1]